MIDKILESILFLTRKSRGYKFFLLKWLLSVKKVMKQEGIETKEMLSIYYKFTKGKATKEELDIANEQFKDVLRAAGIGAFLILPFAPITIPFIVKLANKLGIEIMPSSLKDQDNSEL